ncbi:MAG: DPP IV N-terminal domain-containing protein [Acidobacteriota bacterium]|nr:DPP IV N-terminal domain-containing protein [Acidobacteriota bacterium]MDE3266473.1 DPP IV N-terminal domain-containing protein [Acidobacteriota bacterium]
MRAYRSRDTPAAVVLASILALAGCDSGRQTGPDADDYHAAAALVESNLLSLLHNAEVAPHWLDAGAGEGFWYQRDGEAGPELAVFDLQTRSRRPAFDHARMAASIAEALTDAGAPAADAEPPTLEGLVDLRLSGSLTKLTARAGGYRIECSVSDYGCEAEATTLFSSSGEPIGRYAPDFDRQVLVRDDDLFVVGRKAGDETRLTFDGEPYFSYAKWPDASQMTMVVRKMGWAPPPYSTTWSPDGRYVLVPRIDERSLGTVPLVEWVPTDGSRRPVVHALRLPLAGDAETMGVDWFLFDTEKGGRVQVDFDRESLPEALRTPELLDRDVEWDLERERLYLLAAGYAGKSGALVAIDIESGKATPVMWETSETRVERNTRTSSRANVRFVRGPNDERWVLWYSDRTGWGHLYLYELTKDGSVDLLGALTAGDWAVLDIIEVDETDRQVYFTGGGREPGRDPYFRHLYRVSFDPASSRAGEVILLTPNDADHHFDPDSVRIMQSRFGFTWPGSPIRTELGVFLDTYSTVDRAPVTVLRSTEDGEVLAEVEKADTSALFNAGYTPPERRAFTAADGETDVYSVYYAPRRRVEGGRHPVIDAVYGGPQVAVAPRNFVEAVAAFNPATEVALARLGFAVVVTDGRGTPGRSSAFRDAGYPEFTRVGIEDHVAAIRQWAELKPGMDLERVGIYGWSWGGTFAAQAILSRPEFYDVAVSGAGIYDYAAMSGNLKFIGAPVYADGGRIRTRPDEAPQNWEALDVTRMAGNLEGRLLLVYGDMDLSVRQAQTFRLVDALIQANKPYDLLALPNGDHSAAWDTYTLHRTWDYFVEHLLGAEPPRDVTLEVESPFANLERDNP